MTDVHADADDFIRCQTKFGGTAYWIFRHELVFQKLIPSENCLFHC